MSKPLGSSQGADSKNPSFLFSVWFSSRLVHFERHFISLDLAPTRPCFPQPRPYSLSFCPQVEVKSLCKWALNKLMRFWAKSSRIMRRNIFLQNMKQISKIAFIPFLEHPRSTTLGDWAVRVKGSKINAAQFSAICDGFLALLCIWTSQTRAEAKLKGEGGYFPQASSSHSLLSSSDHSLLFCTE